MAILGFDIGGTKTGVVIGTSDGTVRARTQFPTKPELGLPDFLKRAQEVAEGLIARADREPECVSISVGGPMREGEGRLLAPPHLHSWQDEPLRDRLAQTFEMPTYMMHDARAGALAEFLFGVGKGARFHRLVFFTFGTGFGCGLVIDGRLQSIPGEVGHWRVADDGPGVWGKRGALEDFASGAGILAHARRMGAFDANITLPALADMAREGSLEASGVFEIAATEIGRQCARFVDFLAPERIVLGSLAVRCGDLVLDRIRQVAMAESLEHLAGEYQIVPAGLGENLGDVASLCAAIHAGYREDFAGPPARRQLAQLMDLGDRLIADGDFLSATDRVATLLVESLSAGRKVLTCGNGGSAADAAHLAEELVARYRGNRRALPAISLSSDPSVLTCIANDFGWEEVFARQVEAHGEEGDLLVGFTTSGNSENVNRAFERARARGLVCIALTGKTGGKARELAQHVLHVPHQDTARIQEVHGWLLHVLCEAVESQFSDLEA